MNEWMAKLKVTNEGGMNEREIEQTKRGGEREREKEERGREKKKKSLDKK